MKTVRQDMQFVSEAHPDFEKLASPEQLAAVARAKKTMKDSPDELAKKMGAKPDFLAKYKIEVMFEKGRTTLGPNLLGIQLWESGKKFHGGGDQLMFWCMDTESNQGCKAPFSADYISGPVANCPSCGKALVAARAANIRVLRVPTKALAEELVRIWHTLGGSADIYVKYHNTDVHYLAMLKAKGAEVARKLKGMHIYPLKNIIRDTATGADLTGRIYAFLTA